MKGVVVLSAMQREKLWCGLEVGAGQAGVGVWAVLLGRAAAVAVWEAGLYSGEVVLDPFRVGGEGLGVEVELAAGDVHAVALVVVERGPHGRVVDAGVAGGHLG